VKCALCWAVVEPRVLPGVQPWEESMRWPKPVVDLAHWVLFGSWEIFVRLLFISRMMEEEGRGNSVLFGAGETHCEEVVEGELGGRVGDKVF
jgi:hypothetical protein